MDTSGKEVSDIKGATNMDEDDQNLYMVTINYGHHESNINFKRYILKGNHLNKPLDYAIIQYVVLEGEEIIITPHGNAKHNKEPYRKTKHSVLKGIKDNVNHAPDKEIVLKQGKERGEIFNIKSPSDFPRNCKQIYNVKSRSDEADDN